jgi:hypothetical protein
LAGTFERANEVTEGFDIGDIRAVMVIDFAFLIFVFSALFGLCRWIRGQYHAQFWNQFGIIMGWGALGAGLADVIENIALLGYLGDWLSQEETWPSVATVASWVKWVVAMLAVVYGLVGLILWLGRQLRGHR